MNVTRLVPHIQRKDYITKFAACILLGVYWFHPLVWLAYFYMVRDMEMSCDEYVVQALGSEIKKIRDKFIY